MATLASTLPENQVLFDDVSKNIYEPCSVIPSSQSVDLATINHLSIHDLPLEDTPKLQNEIMISKNDVNELYENQQTSLTNSPPSTVKEDIPRMPQIVGEEETADALTERLCSAKSRKEESGGAEIQEGNIKNQLHEIIKEIDMEVCKNENDPRQHTWMPKENYEIIKTPIKIEDIIPVVIPDIVLKEKKQEPKSIPEIKKPPKQFPKQLAPMEPLIIPRTTSENGGPNCPLEIPAGIPLLAKVLPKEEDAHHEKIPLERLFTPASDAVELVPQKKKKTFASSCFYGPNHPTIDDQVELAHKISVSLVDENNKASKGQTMYMKRKNRSSKWIHQGGANVHETAAQLDSEEVEEEKKPSLEKPPMKLLLSPKGIQDYTAVQRHYDELMAATEATVSPPVLKLDVGGTIGSDLESLESPTGKGAALFAKRKKRMDKFIVDETTVQQQKQANSSSNRDATRASTIETLSNAGSDQSIYDNITTPYVNGLSSNGDSFARTGGSVHLPELTQILTQPKTCESSRTPSRSKGSSIRSRSADSNKVKTKSWFSPYQTHLIQKPKEKNICQTPLEDPLSKLRPGSPPQFYSPNSVSVEDRISDSFYPANSKIQPKYNNDGSTIYTADVKVVQRASLPTTPITEFPDFSSGNMSLLNELSMIRDEDKRKSFNLAAKGWGTYMDFYTPLQVDGQ